MSNRFDTDVLIAGAGPTGLALACDLARRGVSFRIVDKAAHYFEGSRGKGLQPRSLEVLDDFGVIDRILENGRFHLPFRGYDGKKVLGDRDIHEGAGPTPAIPYASPLIIPQWRVEEILRRRLAELGGRVELATELSGFEQNADGVLATLTRPGASDSEQVAVRYLVGADGGHSFVRTALQVGFEGETWPSERMYVGDVRTDELDRDHWHSWPDKERGWVALCPLPSTDAFQFQGQIAPEETAEPSLERFQKIIDERTGGFGIKLHDATWLSLYRVNIRMVDRYRVGRVFLAGDAAHVHSPAGGQGMNTGIQDAYNLGWKLGRVIDGAPAEILDTYEEERLPVAAAMLGITSRLHRQMLDSDSKVAKRGPETLQLGINYRGHSLSRDTRKTPGEVQAGDRAPDAPCQDREAKPIRFFDLFRGPHFTLLGFGAEALSAISECARPDLQAWVIVQPGESTPEKAIVDSDGHARNAYGVDPGTLVLVRPDGYIGVIAENRAAIDDYLRSVRV